MYPKVPAMSALSRHRAITPLEEFERESDYPVYGVIFFSHEWV